MGYRHYDVSETKPQFAFGYGMSYTTFKYSDLRIDREKGRDLVVKIRFTVKNTGSMTEQKQHRLYSTYKPKVERPYKELKGFAKHFIRKNTVQEIEITLDKDAFSYYKTELKDFDYDVGSYEVLVGSASDDIRLRKVIQIEK